MNGIFKRRGKNKEADPKFTIEGNDGLRIAVKRFFVVCSRPRKVIVLGHVTDGEVKVGDSFKMISLNGEEVLESSVSRIERENKKILYAVKNEHVGFCLKGVTIRQLREFNNNIPVSEI